MSPARIALAACLLLAGALAAPAQDLNQRRGFRIAITSPSRNAVVSGETLIKADVTAPQEQDIARVDFWIDDKRVFSDTEPPWQYVHDFGEQGGHHVIRTVAHHRDGPEVSAFVITRGLELQYTVNVQRVVLDVSVRDRKERPVFGLTADQFRVAEDGKPQKVLAVSTEKRPILVGVLLDSSGSMKDRLGEAQEAACSFIEALRPEDQAFVVDFDEAVYLIQETTADHKALCEALKSTDALGGTALYDAVHASYRVLNEATAERRAIVLLTDGDDTESRIDFDRLLEEVRLSNVTIYSIGLKVGALGTASRSLERLAEETGGRSYMIDRAAELGSTYEQIAEELRTLYQLTYASDNEKFDGRFIEIRVGVASEDRLDVRHRSGYHAAR